MSRRCSILLLLPFLFSLSGAAAAVGPISYNRDIRPVLSENCFYCHGPDPNKRKGKLRLDVREEAIAKKRSEEHTSELQSRLHLVCRLLLEKKKKRKKD